MNLRDIHKNMITEVIRTYSVPCKIIYGDTVFIDCPNCDFDPVSGKSTNRYTAGGPVPFTKGVCPYCHGAGRIAQEETETVNLAPVYDYKKWIPGLIPQIQSPHGLVQTVSLFDETFDKLRRAKELIINTDIESHVNTRFQRFSDPEPCGIGKADFVITLWQRIEGG
jgi:hypothetical protein